MRRRFTAHTRTYIGLMAAVGVATAAMLTAAAFAAGGKVTIGLKGAIIPSCALAGNGTSDTRQVDFGDIGKSGLYRYGYDIQCNAPFSYKLESANGAMVLQAQVATSTPGFANRVPYTVLVHIPTDEVAINDRCTSESLKALTCLFSSSGNGIAIDGHATLTLTWEELREPLAAGRFKDRLTFSVGVRQ